MNDTKEITTKPLVVVNWTKGTFYYSKKKIDPKLLKNYSSIKDELLRQLLIK